MTIRASIELATFVNENDYTLVAWCYDENMNVIMRRLYRRDQPTQLAEFIRDTMTQVKNELKVIDYEVIE